MCSNASVNNIDYIVLKINGSDISQMPRYDAVQMFLQANDPIVVEMRRTTEKAFSSSAKLNHIKMTSISNKLANTCSSAITAEEATQQQQFVDNGLLLTLHVSLNAKIEPITEPMDVLIEETKPLSLNRTTQTDDKFFDIHNHDQHLADRLIEQEHNLFEQCLEPEIDFEEITLTKSNSNERLGLSVCFNGIYINNEISVVGGNNNNNNNGALSSSDENETFTEVYISDIQMDSIAARDGRLRQGDQILQINGKDIKNKEETESLIAENNNSVTLLVSRYLYPEYDASEDDDEDDVYYVDNNLEYANAFLNNEYTNVVDELEKVSIATTQQQTQQSRNADVPTTAELQLIKSTANTSSGLLQIKPDAANMSSKVKFFKQSNSAIGVEMLPPPGHKPIVKLTTRCNANKICQTSTTPKTVSLPTSKRIDYDETEHIYETIPEDSESEPFYCSPYEGSTYMTAVGSCSSAAPTEAFELQQQKQHSVAQWLGIKSHATPITTTTPLSNATRQMLRNRNSLTRHTNTKHGTVKSVITNITSGSSSSGGCGGVAVSNSVDNTIHTEELDNSSSAYNTGGSNNSAVLAPLVVSYFNKSNQSFNDDDQFQTKTTRSSMQKTTSGQRLQLPKEQAAANMKNQVVPVSKPVGITSTGVTTSSFDTIARIKNVTESNIETMPTDTHQQQQLLSKTLYNNGMHQHQTMMLQQELYLRSTLQLKQNPHEQQQQLHNCPQFTAPNLSKYHFVSSQEVTSANISPTVATAASSNTAIVFATPKIDETTTMVWKVKRRPDGSRYIVRRPARNRMVMDVRKNIRHHDMTTTTEDDTVSEVKIGRYWSKEDRKKHIERARERRLQQQQQQFQLE